jgi:ABC-type dipeptide/oligopeptide/nickel transport system ATPase component
MKPFLEVKNLNVSFPTEDGEVMASQDISFSVATLQLWGYITRLAQISPAKLGLI